MKTTDLTGPALDWAVAKASNNLHPVGDVRRQDGKVFTIESGGWEQSDTWMQYSPSTDWSQGGPIIEDANIQLWPPAHPHYGLWGATSRDLEIKTAGRGAPKYASTPLIAAMRCFVVSKLGEDVDIPAELQ